MKKLILNLLVSNILIVNSTLVLSCGFSYHNNNNNVSSATEETNFILDLDNEEPIIPSRGWKGTLLDSDSMNEFLKSESSPYTSFDNEQSEFIRKFTRALHFAASKESNKKFDNFLSQKRFLTFNDLVNTINNHNLNSSDNSYIVVPLEIIRSHTIEPDLFENTMLKIYNTLSYFFGKNYGYKILRTLAIVRSKPDQSEVNGETGYNYKSIYMKIKEDILKANTRKFSYDDGWFTTRDMFGTFVHEFGHLIDFFHESEGGFHENIDNYSGLNNDYLFEANAHNEYKQKYCSSWNQRNKACPYKISTKVLPVTREWNNKDYSLIQTEALIDFLLKKVKNLKIPGKTYASQYEFTEEMLIRILINSNYGRSKIVEIHAEGFAYWLLTPENERNKAWEIWNEFFLDYLPKLRAAIPHFNYYLKSHNS